MQGAAEERLARRLAIRALRPDLHEGVASLQPLHLHIFRGIAEVDLHLVRDVFVERLRPLHEPVAPTLEVVDEAHPIELEVLGGHAPGRPLDNLVRDLRLELGRDFLPNRPLQTGEKLTILVPPIPGETLHPRVVVAVVLEDGDAWASDVENEPFIATEGLVPVVGDGLPELLLGELRPPPLVTVTVKVADQDIQEAGLQQGPRVRPVLEVGLDPLVKDVVLQDLSRVLEAWVLVGLGPRILVDLAHPAREVMAELPKQRVVGHDHEPLLRAQNPRRLLELVHDKKGCGMIGCDLVLDEAFGPGIL